MRVVTDEHDAVASGDAEESDKADERGDRQRAAGQKDHNHAADQSERQICHDQERGTHRSECDVKQQEDAGNGDNGEQQ